MKKFFCILFVLLLYPLTCLANNYRSYNDFFSFNPSTKMFVLQNINKKQLKIYNKQLIQNYKIAKNLNKLYVKNENDKILKKYPDFIPSLYAMYKYNYDKHNYNTSLEILTKIKNSKQFNNDEYLNLLFFKTYYANGNYQSALNSLLSIKNKQDLYVFIADCYLNLNHFNEAINYALKVQPNNNGYYLSQETLFKAYYRQKKYENAKQIASYLIKLEPFVSDNYLRYALCETDKNQKLKYFYMARNHEENESRKTVLNGYIIILEQEKIDNVYKKLKMFVEKPDWLNILDSCEYGDINYWLKRQDNFFKKTNMCISKYSDSELAKCFANVNSTQNKLNENITQQVKDKREEEYKKIILRQNEILIRQQMIQNINQIDTNYHLRELNNNIQQQNYQLQKINNSLMW